VKSCVLLLLPAGGSLITEENPAPKRPIQVDLAKLILLERAPASTVVSRLLVADLGGEGGQFHCCHKESMPKFIESAASPGGDADRLSQVDGILERAVDVFDGLPDLGAPRRRLHGVGKLDLLPGGK
jgi:hypothetical protein